MAQYSVQLSQISLNLKVKFILLGCMEDKSEVNVTCSVSSLRCKFLDVVKHLRPSFEKS